MRRSLSLLIVLLFIVGPPAFGAKSKWGGDYFPNVELTTHQGKKVKFFDLIEDKVVVINFIYTICPDSCPLETARLAEVQKILGDRVGKDIFMYSISIDPERDTPEVLAKYAERYKARPGWWFLTGNEDDITELRKKLGLYIDEIQDGSLNHNLSLIIGNQATGQWMKRSPFENPYVLATQIGRWLSGWKAPPVTELEYSGAPELRSITQGEHLFRTRCVTCHTIGGGEEGLAPGLIGPDLLDVHKIRERAWLERWIIEPDEMLEERDPLAMALFTQYNELPMPNMRMSPVDTKDVLTYIEKESRRVQMQRARDRRRDRPSTVNRTAALADLQRGSNRDIQPAVAHGSSGSSQASTSPSDAVAIMNAWIQVAHVDAASHAGYMTLVNIGDEGQTLVAVDSPDYGKVELHQMSSDHGMMKMEHLQELTIAAGAQARFEPHGKHLMLLDPKRALKAGDRVDLKLRFESGQEQNLTVSVVVAE